MQKYNRDRPANRDTWYNRRLLDAVAEGTLEEVQAALAAKGELCVRDEEGSTLLLRAAINNDRPEVSTFLANQGIDILASNAQRLTPLHAFSDRGWLELMQRAISEGESTVIKDAKRATPAYYAIIRGHPDAVALLIKNGASLQDNHQDWSTPVHWAHPNVVPLLVAHGLGVNARNRGGETPLYRAAKYMGPEKIQCLHDHGCDLDLPDHAGVTPLIAAVIADKSSNVRLLLDLGADSRIKALDGSSVVDLVAEKPQMRAIVHAHLSRQAIRTAARVESQTHPTV